MDGPVVDTKTPVASGDPIADARTLPEIFRARAALTPDKIAYRQYDVAAGAWVDWTWRAMAADVARWRAAFTREGLGEGARVATLMANSVGYVCVDQAALALGLVIVPLHVTDNPGNLAYIVGDSGASALVVDTAAEWARLAPHLRDNTDLKRVMVLTKHDEEIHGDARVVAASQWLAATPAQKGPDAVVAANSLAAIVYTSGTTGRPKGVMLSHANVVSNVLAVRQCIAAEPDDLYLSFLPLSHTFERTAGYYLPIAVGGTVAFARSVAYLSEDLRSIRPSVLISVPRIYERAYLAIHERLAKGGLLARVLSRATESVGWRRFLAGQAGAKRGLSLVDRLAWAALDRLVASKVRAAFGGRLRIAVAGGAPMPLAVSRFFLVMGVAVEQGYGMTESSPIISVNRPERNDPESVGETIPGVEVRIGDNDELMVRGPGVMLGYWRRPEETAHVLEPDGWLHTGDQASLRDGRIVIKGRIKDIIVTSTGEKVSPADLEQAIGADPLFEQTMVIGEQRPFVAALAVLNRGVLVEAAKAIGLTGAPEDIIGSDRVRALALARIKHAVAQFPDYAAPRKIVATLEPWTIDAGLMTPTLKLKRKAIEEVFRKEIAGLYGK
jgi:long-chain acyl-CoA synthetase